MPSLGQSGGHNTKHDNRYCNDDTNYQELCQSILDNFKDTYESVRLKNMDIYGVRGSRTIRNKKLQIKKALEKYRDTGYCSPSLKSFIALTYNIEENDMYHKEEMENYEEYEDIYNDITKHGSFESVTFCNSIVNDIVGNIMGTSNNPDEYIKVKKEYCAVVCKNVRLHGRMEQYIKFVALPMDSIIKFKCIKCDGSVMEGEGRKITNTFYGKSKRKIELQTIGTIVEKIDVNDMIL